MKRHKITKVDEGGIAEELGIEEGDFLLAINDKEIEDIFDYDFIVNDEYLEVLIEKANGEEWLLEVEKDYDEDLGMEFGESDGRIPELLQQVRILFYRSESAGHA